MARSESIGYRFGCARAGDLAWANSSIVRNSASLTGCTERREPRRKSSIFASRGSCLQAVQRQRRRKDLFQPQIDHVPDRIVRRGFRIEMVVFRVPSRRIGIRLANTTVTPTIASGSAFEW